ncbi:MAG: DUF3524 domain-containing protein [Desulfobacteraceae bacterium]|nr:DUF3524 domain-containing protein [Desulfobacteraceae bacterium]
MTSCPKILFIEPFYGGSHRDVADGLAAYSRYHIDVVTLPDRFWKWRMRGAALYLFSKIKKPQIYQALITSSLLNLADLKALWPDRSPPSLFYFHENQVIYPLSYGERRDYQYGFTNIISAAVADCVLFNSKAHRQGFLAALPGFLRKMPDFRPKWVIKAIEEKSNVVYPGCHFPAGPVSLNACKPNPPIIIWNHRWEHDKNPEAFFEALCSVQAAGKNFRIALLGESFANSPEIFQKARELFGERIIQYGFASSKKDYFHWLSKGAIVISTAIEENFGIAVVEAIRHRCLPLLPNRLSYPEIIPQAYHNDFLYNDQQDLIAKLGRLLDTIEQNSEKAFCLASAMERFAWPIAVKEFDAELDVLIKRSNLKRK